MKIKESSPGAEEGAVLERQQQNTDPVRGGCPLSVAVIVNVYFCGLSS